MDMVTDPKVLVIGGGIAGLSAAVKLAAMGLGCIVVEKAPFLGGHAARFACKATDACVSCGACMLEEKRRRVIEDPRITVMTRSRVTAVSRGNGNGYRIAIDHFPSAASLGRTTVAVQAIIIATGFATFDPVDTPYGYRHFRNVITNLDLERMLRENSLPLRPSDNRAPDSIAFIQCVGSRDAQRGHLWCSKVCCGSALRSAQLVASRRPKTEITVFYIDIQTFGKNFAAQFSQLQKEVKMVRAVPADILAGEADRLRVVYFDPAGKQSCEDIFDMVVLSVGIVPSPDNRIIADLFQQPTADSGFLKDAAREPIFVAGAAGGPMSIAESAASAGLAAFRVATALRGAR